MTEAAQAAPPNAGAATAEHAPPAASASDYLVLKIADLDQKTIGNIRNVDKEGLPELTSSIKAQGVLEPVLVREAGGKFQLLAGFRRVAAAKAAGLTYVPARILELNDPEVREIQLMENLQRQDLSPLEEARALRGFLDENPEVTQEQLGKRIGKSQPYIANRIRLLGLPEPVLAAVQADKISASHAEVFLQLPKEATVGEVQGLLESDIRNGPSTAQLAREVRWKAETVNRRTQAKKARTKAKESAKFPDCPKEGCGKHGSPELEYGGGVRAFYCGAGHRWSPKTGKLEKAQPRDGGSGREREPAKPTLPVVGDLVPFSMTPQALVEFLTAVDWSVSYVDAAPGRKGVEFSLAGRSARQIPSNIPHFDLGGHRTKAGTVSMRGCNKWAQQTDRERKAWASRREALEAWAAKLAKAQTKAKAEPKSKSE